MLLYQRGLHTLLSSFSHCSLSEHSVLLYSALQSLSRVFIITGLLPFSCWTMHWHAEVFVQKKNNNNRIMLGIPWNYCDMPFCHKCSECLFQHQMLHRRHRCTPHMHTCLSDYLQWLFFFFFFASCKHLIGLGFMFAHRASQQLIKCSQMSCQRGSDFLHSCNRLAAQRCRVHSAWVLVVYSVCVHVRACVCLYDLIHCWLHPLPQLTLCG